MNVLRADANYSFGKFGTPRCQHQRIQTMGNQVAKQTRAIRIEFAPAEEMVRVEFVGPLLYGSQPGLPIDGVRAGNDAVIPFAVRIVAKISASRPDEFPKFARFDDTCRLVPTFSGGALRT